MNSKFAFLFLAFFAASASAEVTLKLERAGITYGETDYAIVGETLVVRARVENRGARALRGVEISFQGENTEPPEVTVGQDWSQVAPDPKTLVLAHPGRLDAGDSANFAVAFRVPATLTAPAQVSVVVTVSGLNLRPVTKTLSFPVPTAGAILNLGTMQTKPALESVAIGFALTLKGSATPATTYETQANFDGALKFEVAPSRAVKMKKSDFNEGFPILASGNGNYVTIEALENFSGTLANPFFATPEAAFSTISPLSGKVKIVVHGPGGSIVETYQGTLSFNFSLGGFCDVGYQRASVFDVHPFSPWIPGAKSIDLVFHINMQFSGQLTQTKKKSTVEGSGDLTAVQLTDGGGGALYLYCGQGTAPEVPLPEKMPVGADIMGEDGAAPVY